MRFSVRMGSELGGFMSKYCHKCGHEMHPGEVYCSSCKAMSNEELSPERIAEIQANNKTSKKGCFVFLAIIILFMAGFGVLWFVGGEEVASSMVLILVFAVINFILFRLNKQERVLKTSYYTLTLKDNLDDVDEKCPNCNAVFGDNDKFCGSCGAQVQQKGVN